MKYLSILLIAFLAACGGGSEEKKTDAKEEKDTTETKDTNTVDVEEAVENPEETSIEEFEKAEGGMSFCDCVKKMNELEAKSMEAETDEETEAALTEMGALRDGDCKVLKVGGQESPEDRAARQRKAAACK